MDVKQEFDNQDINMATTFLGIIVDLPFRILTPNWRMKINRHYADAVALFKWQSYLIILTIFLGLAQRAAVYGDVSQAILFGTLAITELLVAVLTYPK